MLKAEIFPAKYYRQRHCAAKMESAARIFANYLKQK